MDQTKEIRMKKAPDSTERTEFRYRQRSVDIGEEYGINVERDKRKRFSYRQKSANIGNTEITKMMNIVIKA
ncbi:hypothetical protein F8M41_022311 [Gigaspora margarita]|uniref:Uncharacterized protein n=1 Tax=Gigaspora margarita TaxID=4874 RepID=A0A8H4AF94_GIGMA|nr:hypothetical protein F8M41_022311 [Gigaspora margarita]